MTRDGLTVLLPARNAEKTIRGAVHSVLRALPAEGSVLVLNDASDDATGDILQEMARDDGRVGVMTSAAPLGVAKALNELVDASKTELVARMDADDIALPWRFNCQLRAMHRKDFDVVFSPVIMFGPARFAITPQAPVPTRPAASPFELLLASALIHPTLVGRRRAFVGAGGYRPVPAEDWDLFMRMALRGDRLARIALPSLLYRRHPGQVTASTTWRSAHAAAPETAQVHQELGERLLGFGHAGAYAALSGAAAGANEVKAAWTLIKAVRDVANSFPATDRLSMRTIVLIATRRMNRLYGPSE